MNTPADDYMERFAIRVMGQEAFDNSPCNAHPLEAVEMYLAAAPAQAAPEGVAAQKFSRVRELLKGVFQDMQECYESQNMVSAPSDEKWREINVAIADLPKTPFAPRPSSDGGLTAAEVEALLRMESALGDWIGSDASHDNATILCAAVRRLSGAVSVDEGMVERALSAPVTIGASQVRNWLPERTRLGMACPFPDAKEIMRAALTAALQAPAP